MELQSINEVSRPGSTNNDGRNYCMANLKYFDIILSYVRIVFLALKILSFYYKINKNKRLYEY